MKKIWLMLLVSVFSIFLIGCVKKEEVMDSFPENDSLDWGINLSIKDVSKTGLTIVFEQSGGNVKGEFIYGEDYKLYVKKGDGWTAVPYILEDAAWNSIGYIIEKDSIVEQKIDWTWLYGELKKGTYKLEKEILDTYGSGYDKALYYAEFEIK